MKKAIFVWLLIIPLCYSCTKMWEDLDFDYGNSDTIHNPFGEEDDFELWQERVLPIVEGCTTDYEKARAIFEWECANIAYDVDFKIYHAYECWEQRKGVCQAYSELFVKLAYGCDLEAVLLSGKARTSNNLEGEAGHAWVKVHTEKGWMLCDPTWGAGAVSMDHTEFYFNEYNMSMSWFDADPEIVVFTHFPKNSEDQFLNVPITADQYRHLPDISAAVVPAGWKAHDVLDYFLSHPGESAPTFYGTFYDYLGKFELIQVPYNGKMRVGETYVLKIRSLALEEGVSIGSWGTNNSEGWEQDGDLFTLVYTPESEGELHISLDGYGGIMKYEVVN